MDRFDAAKITAQALGLKYWTIQYDTHSAVLFRNPLGNIEEWEPWHSHKQAFKLIDAFITRLCHDSGEWRAEIEDVVASDPLLTIAVLKAVYGYIKKHGRVPKDNNLTENS